MAKSMLKICLKRSLLALAALWLYLKLGYFSKIEELFPHYKQWLPKRANPCWKFVSRDICWLLCGLVSTYVLTGAGHVSTNLRIPKGTFWTVTTLGVSYSKKDEQQPVGIGVSCRPPLEAAPLLELEDPPAAIGVSKTHALFILKAYTTAQHCSTKQN